MCGRSGNADLAVCPQGYAKPLCVLDRSLPDQPEATVICVCKILRIFAIRKIGAMSQRHSLLYASWYLTTQEQAMNTFCEHHQNSIKFWLSLFGSDPFERIDSALSAAPASDRFL